MCGAIGRVEKAWQGWLDVPPPRASASTARWIELSHVITETLARIPAFPQPRIRRIKSMPDFLSNVTEMTMVAHHGTHVDAPVHYIADGPSMDQVPLDRLYGEGVVWRIDVGERGVMEPAHFEAARPRLKPGDIVILDTGTARHVNSPRYWDHPIISLAAAEWLVAQGVKLLAVDSPTPDMSPGRRPADHDFPTHHTLLSHGVLIAEHMTGLEALAGQRIEAMFMAINLEGSDGAPARVVARALHS
jgi:kynurenine formamidase